MQNTITFESNISEKFIIKKGTEVIAEFNTFEEAESCVEELMKTDRNVFAIVPASLDMPNLSPSKPQKIATLTVVKRIPSSEENIRFFNQNDLDEITQCLINEGFDPSDLIDTDQGNSVDISLIEAYERRCEWEAEGNCTLCGEYMIEDNSGDEHNPAMFAACSNGCL